MTRGENNQLKVKKRAIDLAREGFTTASIARRLRLPYTTVWYWFKNDPIAQEAFRTAEAIVVSAANDHIADILLDPLPVHEGRKDRIALEVLKAAERRPPPEELMPTKDDLNQMKKAIRDALRDHPKALKDFTRNMKAARKAALDDAAKSNR